MGQLAKRSLQEKLRLTVSGKNNRYIPAATQFVAMKSE
jgi:ribosomal protein L39E